MSEQKPYLDLSGLTSLMTSIKDKFATKSELASKSDSTHNHDSRYYTETEMNNKLAAKSDVGHTHNSLVAGDVQVSLSQDTTTSYALSPDTASSYAHNLGTSGAEWDSVYTDSLVLNGADVGNKLSSIDSSISSINTTLAGKANISHTHTIANVTDLQATLDGKAASSHTHTVSQISDLTATAKELNYIDGVTSNVQTQINSLNSTVAGKANSSHTHTVSQISDLTATAAELNYMDGVTSNVQSQIDSVASDVLSKANVSHTHTNATTSAAGFMSSTDKSKLDGIANNANNYSLPAAGTTLGGVKSGGDVTISSGLITVNDNSHAHTIANVTGLQTALEGKSGTSHTHDDRYYTESEIDAKLDAIIGEGAAETLDTIGEISDAIQENQSMLETLNSAIGSKQSTITGAATTITSTNLTANKALISNSSGKVATSGVSSTELGYVSGVTSNIQTQLNNKAAASHTHDDRYYTETEIDAKVNTLNSSIAAKANSADIATTASYGISNSANQYMKVYDFGAWGTGVWYQKGFSMLLTSRAGELVWVAVSSDDAGTNAKAIRLLNTYGKINGIWYSASESAIYCQMKAWCNNLNAHVISNVNGDYVPAIATASALPDDAVSINIVEFGVSGSGTQVGDTSVNLLLGGAATRPTYNGGDVALLSDVNAVTLDTLGGNDRYYTETEIDSKIATLDSAIAGKANSSHTHNYAGSSTAGGSATSAVKLTSSGGSATQPVYFADGKPVACSYSLNKTVPSNAVFTDTTYSAATSSAAGLMSATDKGKLDTIASGAQVNQNAFSNVVVGSSTLAADNTTDTLTLIAGSNVQLTPDVSGDKVTIAATDTVYTHPNSGVSAGTYKSVTVNAAGHVTAGTNPTTLSGYGITDAAAKSHTHAISEVTSLQATLDGKAASSHTHTVSNISDLTATAAELNYCDGVTSNIQSQLDSKCSKSVVTVSATEPTDSNCLIWIKTV